MKQFYNLAIFLLTILSGSVLAQTTAPGYYIKPNGDSVAVEVRIKKSLSGKPYNDFLNELEIVDSLHGKVVLTPPDAKRFAFFYNGMHYRFFSKPVKNGDYKFLSPVYTGPKYSLYQYGTFTSGGGYAMASSKVFYTFEKADGSFLFLTNRLNKDFRDQIKSFFADSPQALQMIDNRLKYWQDLQADLMAILIVANR